ncbi:MAG: UDP-N-acetylglucosamine 1-carboxyvinyltransferase [Deltaproteobacteria bacterium]|nr:UDP-N-acetylglucosamine 1-carboxyvinyltransferase [Deltaproteobacteria bacterium]HCH65593.1 UDP-N-acetylglucosamine 1-carboxyvinyltransferase [Deltaproteobacteria bacterium]
MDKLVIDGGYRLSGRVPISGAKNAALPILIATLLASGQHTIDNVPELVDISTTLSLLGRIGCPSLVAEPGGSQKRGRVVIDTTRIAFREAPYDLVRKMRASVLALGPLLARCGEARVSLPGGCAIGVRPIDQHLKGLEALGCRFELTGGYVHGRADRLVGAEIHLDFPTVTGTENILMAAVLADGVTRIHNAAKEPEVADLARFLRSMGARIEGEGTSTLTIDGVPALRPSREPHSVLPDRIEAGTYLTAALTTRGDITVTEVDPRTLEVLVPMFQAAGATVSSGEDWMRVVCDERPQAVSVETQPHPGFPTDMQAQWMAAMTLAAGTSVLRETIFENRFMHVPELMRLGAEIQTRGNESVVEGAPHLTGATVMATDLRASASLVLAGLAAQGQTQLLRLYHLDRGYARLVEKLGDLGARVVRVADDVSVPVGSIQAAEPSDSRAAG